MRTNGYPPRMTIFVHQSNTFATRMAHRRMIRWMGSEVIPRDKSWQVLVPFALIVAANAILFVRWWLCV